MRQKQLVLWGARFVVAMASLICMGCGIPEAEHQEALDALDSIRAQLDQANEKLSQLEAEVTALRETDEAYWKRIIELERRSEWQAVRSEIDELLKRWPESDYKKKLEALDKKAFDEIAADLYGKARTAIDAGKFEEARLTFVRIGQEYPSSPASKKADADLKTLDEEIREAKIRSIGTGAWNVSDSVSPVDDSTNVYLSLKSERTIRSKFGKNERPRLHLRCKENTTEVFVTWDVYLGLDGTHVLSRLDDSKAKTQMWSISTNHKATFFRGSDIGFAKQLLGHDKLFLQTTPYGESPVMATFNLEGLVNAIRPLRQACGW